MEHSTAAAALRGSAGWVVTMGVLMVIFGVLSITMPLVTGVALAYLVGGVVTFAGVALLAHAFRAASWGAGLGAFIVGAAALLCGLLMLAHPLMNLNFMTFLLAVWFVVDGVSSISIGMRLRGHRGAGWSIFSGVVSLVLGVTVLAAGPGAAWWLLGLLVGIQFLMAGSAMIALGSAARASTGAAA